MDPELSEEHQQLRATVRRFLADRAPIATHVRPQLGDGRGLDPEVWDGLAGLGVLGLLTGGEHGTDLLGAGVVAEECGRALLPEPFLASAVGAATALRGTEADGVAARLDAIAHGTQVLTVAVHEPGRRYDWRSPTTCAARAGAGWELTGRKDPVLAAAVADAYVVTAADPAGALALFLVDRADGARVLDRDSTDGTRPQGELVLDRTPARRLDCSDPVAHVRRLVDVVGLGLCLDAVGAATAALELAVEYAKQRVQFGVPIGSFQAVQHLCADMLRDVEMARAGVEHAAWAGQAEDDETFHRAAAMAQAYASETLPHVGETAIQVLGGIGFTWEHDIHLFYKRLLSAAALFGNADAHYADVASFVIDGPGATADPAYR